MEGAEKIKNAVSDSFTSGEAPKIPILLTISISKQKEQNSSSSGSDE